MNFLWFRTWQIGIKSLLLHPLRSLLTVLGILVGVASVIWLLAIAEGISREAQKQIEGLGADNIIIRSVKPPAQVQAKRQGVLSYGITRADYRRITSIPEIRRALPIREIRQTFTVAHRGLEGRMVGCTPEYAEVNQLTVQSGRFLSDADCRQRKSYCVLAAEVARTLFQLENPLGKSVRVARDYYEVVGVMKPRASTAGIGGSFAAQDFHEDIYVPYETVRVRIGDSVTTRTSGSFSRTDIELNQITLRIDGTGKELEANVRETAALAEQLLRKYHPDKDYSIAIPLDLLERAKTTRLMFIVFMGLIAAISLLVGGIGIMNIMLATVTERTREIGIRRALGAKQGDIIRQFLTETVALSTVGGIAGILVGLLCGPVIRQFREWLGVALPKVMEQLPPVIRSVDPAIVPWSIPAAFGISVAVGIIFGLYPAIRAAALDPIEALRHE